MTKRLTSEQVQIGLNMLDGMVQSLSNHNFDGKECFGTFMFRKTECLSCSSLNCCRVATLLKSTLREYKFHIFHHLASNDSKMLDMDSLLYRKQGSEIELVALLEVKLRWSTQSIDKQRENFLKGFQKRLLFELCKRVGLMFFLIIFDWKLQKFDVTKINASGIEWHTELGGNEMISFLNLPSTEMGKFAESVDVPHKTVSLENYL